MNAHYSGQDKEIVVAITREVCDKGTPEIQHVGCKAGRLDDTDKQYVEQKSMSNIEIGEA